MTKKKHEWQQHKHTKVQKRDREKAIEERRRKYNETIKLEQQLN